MIKLAEAKVESLGNINATPMKDTDQMSSEPEVSEGAKETQQPQE